ncbi:acylphosphatase [Oerskovia sp. NPDC056781]|uniref:acylphosphatase n=1 Tax=Oerskovia sp. NPDC056781 TaxID=3345942 RepID=UPI0036732120
MAVGVGTAEDGRSHDGRGEAAVRVVVHGHVQGVGFRWATIRQSAALGLACDAQNLPDGTVLVTARGEASALGELLDWLRSGRTPGHVTRVDEDPV